MEDREIIALFWARSQEAIRETARKYGAYCGTIIRRVLGDGRDAEECLNDTWLGAWNAMPPQRPNRLNVFLGRIARNLALDRYDYNHAAKRSGSFDQLLSELNECIPYSRDDFARMELTQILNSFFRTLPEAHRNLFLRRYWYADSVEAVALRLGWSVSKTKSALFRMRKKLKDYLVKEELWHE